jgi:hypothetical protein
MKNLIVTDEMKKSQDIAKKIYSENKVYDLDAVSIGWKIDTGRVIEVEGATIELTGCPQRLLYDAITNAPAKGINNRKSQVNMSGIAMLILVKNATVYYSK